MIALINAGGSGTRLWPLSTPDYPKHLLSLSPNSDSSLLQDTYQRALQLTKDVYVFTTFSHAHHIKDQLPELPDERIIIQPARRGTAEAFILALTHIGQHHSPSTPMALFYADHVIHDVAGFITSIKNAAKASRKHKKITVLGIKPSYPSTGFGYIRRGDKVSTPKEKDVFSVSDFTEKPDSETANEYTHSGEYFWNTAYYVAPLNIYEKYLKSHNRVLYNDYLDLKKAPKTDDHFLSLDTRQTELALIQPVARSGELIIVPGNFDWTDIGNFKDLHKATKRDDSGNAISGKAEVDQSENCYVRNESDKEIAVVGLSNIVVVATDNGILVTTRDKTHSVGEVACRINSKAEEVEEAKEKKINIINKRIKRAEA